MASQRPYHVTYKLHSAPRRITTNAQAIVVCTLTNSGREPWNTRGDAVVNVSYRWLDAQGRPLVADGERTPFKAPVAPGESATCELVIAPPEIPGDHTLQIDMVAEQYAWFVDLGLPTLDIPIRVQPSPAGLPRICILNTSLILNDAVANNVMDQARFFLARNQPVTLFVEFIEEGIPEDIRQITVPIRLKTLLSGLQSTQRSWAVRRFLEGDVYIYHYPVYYELVESIAHIKRGTVIFDYHGITPAHLWNDPEGIPLIEKSEARAVVARHADLAMVHSEYMVEELTRHSQIDPRSIRVIPYVVPLDHFAPSEPDAELITRYELSGHFVLLYIGRMAGNKRIDDLVRGLAEVRKRHPNTKLLLVGNNTVPVYRKCAEEALAIARDLGCEEQVVFTGPIPHNQLYRFYNTCHIYATASLHEGFCVPVIEAMSCGRPAVATNVTALPSTVGNAGLLFEPGASDGFAAQVNALLENVCPHS